MSDYCPYCLREGKNNVNKRNGFYGIIVNGELLCETHKLLEEKKLYNI